MQTQLAQRLAVPGRVWPDPQHASVGLGLGRCHGYTQRWLCSLHPPAYSQLPLVVSPEEGVRRSSHCEVTAPCVHQDVQLEKEERGRLISAVGLCCTVHPALSASSPQARDAFPVPTPGMQWLLYRVLPGEPRLWVPVWAASVALPSHRGQGLPRSPLPASWMPCQPHWWAARGWQGSAHAMWARRALHPGSSRGTGRGRAGRRPWCLLWPEGNQEGCRAAAQSPELSRVPLLPCPGIAQRCCAREHIGGAGVSDIRVLHEKQTLSGTVQTERVLSSKHCPASTPVPSASIHRQDSARSQQGVLGPEGAAAREGAQAPLAREPNLLAKLVRRIDGSQATADRWVR